MRRVVLFMSVAGWLTAIGIVAGLFGGPLGWAFSGICALVLSAIVRVGAHVEGAKQHG